MTARSDETGINKMGKLPEFSGKSIIRSNETSIIREQYVE
jgi:hypothetical protein